MIRKVIKCCFLSDLVAIKEIRELDDEVKEVSVADDEGDWEEKNLEEDKKEEEKEEAFSIGDTMLARGGASESWGGGNLEDTINEEDLEEDFGGEDFEEEEEEEGGFSYEAAGEESVGGLYGETTSTGDLYGGRDASVGDLYGKTNREDSVSMYNKSGSAAESSLYIVAGEKKKDTMGIVYKVEGSKKKKSSVRRGPKSGLVSEIKRKRRSKGVSMI